MLSNLEEYLFNRYDGYLSQLDDFSDFSVRSIYECYFRASECLLTLRAANLITAKELNDYRDYLFERYSNRIKQVCI